MTLRARRRGARWGLLVVMALLLSPIVSVVGATASPQPASALSISDFNPGYIISDADFYNSSAMSSVDIQAFLDHSIGSCGNGQCLNVAVVSPPSFSRVVSAGTGNQICAAVTGGTMRTSEWIYRVQVACGISAKVILVTLQKEQGLVTSRAPGAGALKAAMGMACPDTAPCDTAFAGLATQIYTGTKQLMTYKAARFAKQPGVQYVQYNPNAGCGGTTINVSNYATAALYSYTPYQPNAAALVNLTGLGVGDAHDTNHDPGCSTYGNRNFWVFYNTWFGDTPPPPPTLTGSGAIGRTGLYAFAVTNGGEARVYGAGGAPSWVGQATVGSQWLDETNVVSVGDFDGDGFPDLISQDYLGRLLLYSGDGQGGWKGIRQVGAQWNGMTIVAPGDWNGDGKADLLAIDGAGSLWLYPGNGAGGFGGRSQIGVGWGSLDTVLGVGDFDGDGKPDLLARTTSGSLYLYSGSGTGGFLRQRLVSAGWNAFSRLTAAGDINSDGRTDIVAVDSNGDLWTYPGTGTGTFSARIKVGQGWGGMAQLVFVGKRADPVSGAALTATPPVTVTDPAGEASKYLLTVSGTGTAQTYVENGVGGWGRSPVVGAGWEPTDTMVAVGDLDGDGVPDIARRDGSGTLWLMPRDGRGDWKAAKQIATGWGDYTSIVGPGDFTGDGKPDLLARDTAGRMLLFPGDGRGGIGAPVVIGIGWGSLDLITAVGDLNNDGANDLVARTPDGDLMLYPGNGRGGFRPRVVIGIQWQTMNLLIGTGNFDGASGNDLLARDGTGNLFLFSNAGNGAIRSGGVVGTQWQGFASIVGVGIPAPTTRSAFADFTGDRLSDAVTTTSAGAGSVVPGGSPLGAPISTGAGWDHWTAVTRAGDFNGDGKQDLLALDASGQLFLLPGTGSGSFGTGVQVGAGFNAYIQIIGVGDFDHDGAPDLIARDALGNLTLYQGNGRGGWLTGNGIKIGIGWQTMTAVFAMGDFDSDGAVDLGARDASGDLWLYRGNGSGGFKAASKIGAGWNGFDTIIGGSDFTGSGTPSVLVRSGGTLRAYVGDGSGGWATGIGQQLVGDWSGFNRIIS